MQLSIDLGSPPFVVRDVSKVLVRRGTDAHPDSVVRDDLEFVNVVFGARSRTIELRQEGVDTTGVVAQHAAQGAPVVEDHRLVAGLAGERRSSTTAEHRNAVAPAAFERCHHIVRISRQDGAHWVASVVGSVARVRATC